MALYGPGKKKRGGQDDDLDITPMIDVTFLLLIFFMVTSTMEDPAALQIPPARHGEGISTLDSTVLTVFNTENEPEIFLADGKRENGPVSLGDVTAYVQTGVADEKLNVIIKADREVPSGFVEEVARAANDVDAELKFFCGGCGQASMTG